MFCSCASLYIILMLLCLFFRARSVFLWFSWCVSRVGLPWNACPSIPFPLRYRQGLRPRHPIGDIPHLGDASVIDQENPGFNQLLVVMLAHHLVPNSHDVPAVGHNGRVERRTVLDEAVIQRGL